MSKQLLAILIIAALFGCATGRHRCADLIDLCDRSCPSHLIDAGCSSTEGLYRCRCRGERAK